MRSKSDYDGSQKSPNNIKNRDSFDSTMSLPAQLEEQNSGVGIIVQENSVINTSNNEDDDDIKKNNDFVGNEFVEEQIKTSRSEIWKKKWKNCKRPG